MDENPKVKKIFEEVDQNLKIQNFELAETNLKRILEIDKTNLKALFLLGSVFLNIEQYDKSVEYLNKVISINPSIVNAYSNLGIVHIKLKQYEDAKKFLKKAIELNSNHLDAHNYLGVVYCELGNFSKALDSVNKALKLDSNFFSAYNNLGIIYKRFEYYNESEDSFKKAIQINFNFKDPYFNLMELYEKTNQNIKLDALIGKFEKIFKKNSVSTLYKSHILFKKELYADSIIELKSISFSNDFNLEIDRTNLLSKCYDKIDDIENAFNYFKKTNLLKLNFHNKEINKNKFLSEIKKRIDYFKNIKNKKYFSDVQNDFKPIFMIGFPRSGTTLLDTILRSHPLIEVVEEKTTVKNIVSSLNNLSKNSLENIYHLEEQKIEKIRKNYFDEFYSHIDIQVKNKIYIDKLPLNIIYIAEILRIFPSAKFIISLRHPCDCVLSCYMQNFKLNETMSNFLNLKDTAETYNLVMNLFQIYKSKFSFNFHEIRYEKLVFNFKNEIENLLKFLELSWDNEILKYQKTATTRDRIFTPSYDQVIKPIYSQSIGRWEKYKKQLSEVYPILEPWIKEFNYE